MNDSSSNTHVVEALERQIEQLKPEDFARLREWFLSYEWDAWDHALEEDVGAGKLDDLARQARADRTAGRTKPL